MEIVRSSKTCSSSYQTVFGHITEVGNLFSHCRENHKSRTYPFFNLSYKFNGEVISLHTVGKERYSHSFLTLVLVAGEWSELRHGLFRTEERTCGTHWVGGCVVPMFGLDVGLFVVYGREEPHCRCLRKGRWGEYECFDLNGRNRRLEKKNP
jgi:hypothetical protein